MRSAISIDVAAPPDVVFGLAHRVEHWDALLPHYARSRVAARLAGGRLLVTFVAIRPLVRRLGFGLPVAWRAQTWNEPERHRLRFRHVAGVTRGMDVTWRIEPTATGCLVTIEHVFTPRLPGLAAFVDRWFTGPIAGRTLATLKALAEAVTPIRTQARTEGPRLGTVNESERVSATNQLA